MLKRHNEYRAKHGVPALTASSSLDLSALSWAQNLASTGSFQHSGTQGVGENLAYLMDSRLSGTDQICAGNAAYFFVISFKRFYLILNIL
jgi:hypothetical protein